MRKFQGFTLIELLVVIAIIVLLMGILVPVTARARMSAKILVAESELKQIGLAIEMYYMVHKEYPPTQEDCHSGSLDKHLYQIPDLLVENEYLPSTSAREPMATAIEDRFHPGHTYKYRSTGEVIVDRDYIDRYIFARLWIPDNFPASSSINPSEGSWRPDEDERERYIENKSLLPMQLPVRWVVFSLGPNFSEERLRKKLKKNFNRYPISKELWYTPEKRRGFIVRMQLKDGRQIGTLTEN